MAIAAEDSEQLLALRSQAPTLLDSLLQRHVQSSKVLEENCSAIEYLNREAFGKEGDLYICKRVFYIFFTQCGGGGEEKMSYADSMLPGAGRPSNANSVCCSSGRLLRQQGRRRRYGVLCSSV